MAECLCFARLVNFPSVPNFRRRKIANTRTLKVLLFQQDKYIKKAKLRKTRTLKKNRSKCQSGAMLSELIVSAHFILREF